MTLTRQQIFDKALRIARSQDGPCANERGWNLFHHNKLRSFIGPWIPIDIAVDKDINGMSVSDCVRVFPEIFDIADEKFICELELIHDDYEPEEWEQQLNDFAKVYDLIYKPKEDIKWERKQLQTHLRAS